MRTSVLALGLVLLCTFSPLAVWAEEHADSLPPEEQGGIRCEQMVLCAGVKDKVPVGVSNTFPSDIYRVYCHTTIVGAEDSTAIVHTWYYDGTEMTAVGLSVKSARWRTWSTKKMASGWRGPWRVEVTTVDGAVIGTKDFRLE